LDSSRARALYKSQEVSENAKRISPVSISGPAVIMYQWLAKTKKEICPLASYYFKQRGNLYKLIVMKRS